MAKKLLTLASYATLTMMSACQLTTETPKREQLTPVVVAAPNITPTAALTEIGPTSAPAAVLSEPAPTPLTRAPKPKANRPQPAALAMQTPMIFVEATSTTEPSPTALNANVGEVATPRVDKHDRPATGNVARRTANF